MFLYYTDTISTVSLLLTYLMAMSRYSLPVGYVKAMRILKTKSYSPKKGDLMRQLSLSDELAPNSRATTPRNSMLSMEGMQKHGDSFDLSLSDNAASLEAWLGHFLLFMVRD